MSPVARYVTIRASIPTIAILPFNDSALLVMQSLMVSFKKSLMGMNLLHIDDFEIIHIEIHQGCIRNYRETTWKGWCLGLKILSRQRCIYRYQRSGFSWLNSKDSSEFKSQSQAYWVFKKIGFHTQLYPQPSDLGCSPLTFASAFRHTPTWHEDGLPRKPALEYVLTVHKVNSSVKALTYRGSGPASRPLLSIAFQLPFLRWLFRQRSWWKSGE